MSEDIDHHFLGHVDVVSAHVVLQQVMK